MSIAITLRKIAGQGHLNPSSIHQLALSLFLLLLSPLAKAQNYWKVTPGGSNARMSNSAWGRSVAVSGKYMVMGSPQYDLDGTGTTPCSDCGGVSVFEWNGSSWVYQQRLVPIGTNSHLPSDFFGCSVAISGDYIVVGANGQDYDAAGTSTSSGAGAAYVFSRSGSSWNFQQKLVGQGTNGRISADQFGTSVAIDGDYIIVGANGQDYDATGTNLLSGAGAAYIFNRSGSSWNFQQKLVGQGTKGRTSADQFGYSVAISGDYVVIGAYNQDHNASGADSVSNAGAAYVFNRSGSAWSFQQKLVGQGTNGRMGDDLFGYAVAIAGESVIVGAVGQDYDATGANFLSMAGAAYVFNRSGSSWNFQQKLTGQGLNGRIASDQFGSAVSINNIYAVIGASGQDYDAAGTNILSGAGAAYLFSRSGSSWSLLQKLSGTGTNGRNLTDQFGTAVSVQGDYIVVGVSGQDYDATGASFVTNAGAAFVFPVANKIWTAAVSSDWHTAGNWSPSGIPSSSDHLWIPSGVSLPPVLSANTTVASINTDTSLSLNGYQLTIDVSIKCRGNGSVKGSTTSSLLLNGSEPSTLKMNTPGNDKYLKDLTLFGTGSLTLTDTLKVSGTVLLDNGILNSNDFLVLTATNTKSYGQIMNVSGTTNGKVTVEKVLSSTNPGWRELYLPVQANLSALSGIDLLGSAHPTANERNIYYWDATDAGSGIAGGWKPANVSTDDQSKAYNIYGNNSNGGLHDISNQLTISGAPTNGNVFFYLYATDDPYGGSDPNKNGWNLVGNPYPSNLDISQLWGAMGFPAYKAIHVYNTNTGQYEAICSTGVSIIPYGGAVSSSSEVIAPFQAFWVKTASLSNMVFTNSMRTTDTVGLGTFVKQDLSILRINIHDQDGHWDQLAIYDYPGEQSAFNEQVDAYKLPGSDPSIPGIYHLSPNGEKASIKALNFAQDSLEMNIGVIHKLGNTLKVFLDVKDMTDNWRYFLKDKLLKSRRELTTKDTVEIAVWGVVEGRYSLLMKRDKEQTGIHNLNSPPTNIWSNGTIAFVNGTNANEVYEVIDLQGRVCLQGKVISSGSHPGIIDLSSLSAGIYIVKVGQNGPTAKVLRK